MGFTGALHPTEEVPFSWFAERFRLEAVSVVKSLSSIYWDDHVGFALYCIETECRSDCCS